MSYPAASYETPESYAPYQSYYDQTATTWPYTQTTYYSTASTTSTVTKDEEVPKWCFNAPSMVMTLLAVIFFMLIGSVTTLILLALGHQLSSGTTETDYLDSSIPGGGGNIHLFLSGADAQNSTDMDTPPAPSASKNPLPKTSSRRPRIGNVDEPLVCTMGAKINSTQMFPPDALCDYILYDSLYKGYTDPLLAPRGFDASLSAFVDAYPTYQATAFGVGIAHSCMSHFASALLQADSSFEPLKPFWEKEIYHYGVLDTPTVDTSEQDLLEALLSLRIVHSRTVPLRRMGNTMLSFLAAAIPNDTLADTYVRYFKQNNVPDVFIALGHYVRGDNTLPTCIIMPPTVLHRPASGHGSYQHDLTSAANGIDVVSTQRSKTKLALSVTLKGRLATGADPHLLAFQDFCISNSSMESFASYAEVCKSPDYSRREIYSSFYEATQLRHSGRSLVFSYDDRTGLSKKLCSIKAQHTSTKFGIAVFDLDYADFSGVCSTKRGPFPILHALRRVLDFFKAGHVTPGNVGDCEKQAT
ncbi:uncharacterized protein LOC119400958 [Rhipicephalus sanguineus]|uniref:uncharacterized protein LOC119400958 n=1 Tax=Rhipicephalus sanguineus TaxID=34632 RepID=UPI0020C234DE|nr:uncharacterized protein LOC119400958 [Rhipicephalus sanguineus]